MNLARSHRVRALAWALAVAARAAAAQSPPSGTTRTIEREAPEFARFDLRYQAALRQDSQTGPKPEIATGGVTPLRVELGAAGFGRWPVGLGARVAVERFTIDGQDLGGDATRLPYTLFGVSAGPAARLALGNFGVGGSVEYQYDQIHLVDAAGTSLSPALAHRHAVAVRAGGFYAPVSWALIEVEGSIPIAFAATAPAGSLETFEWSAGARLAFGRLEMAGVRLALTGGYEYVDRRLALKSDGFSAVQTAHRFSLGLRGTLPDPVPEKIVIVVPPPPPPPPPPPRKPTGPGSIVGTVIAQGKGTPVPGARVALAGTDKEAIADATGSFVLEQVGPGPLSLKITAQGFKPADEAVVVPPEAKATLQVSLQALGVKALATLRGQVRSPKGKPVPASIYIAEPKIRSRAAADGRFTVRVPGGRYSATVEAPGFISQTKVVEVADGDEAVFVIVLHPVRP